MGQAGRREAPHHRAGTADTDTATPSVETTTIQDLNRGLYNNGSLVKITDVVVVGVQKDDKAFFVQDAAGGLQSGLYIWVNNGASTYAVGDQLDIEGIYEDKYDFDRIGVYPTITKTGTAAVPPATELSLAELTTAATAELYEAQLVKVTDASVKVTSTNPDGPDSDYGEIEIGDGTNNIRLAPRIWQFRDTYTSLAVDDTFTTVQGVLDYRFNTFRILPADDTELDGYGPITSKN